MIVFKADDTNKPLVLVTAASWFDLVRQVVPEQSRRAHYRAHHDAVLLS